MTESERYQGYNWIKVKRHVFDPDKTAAENYEGLEAHHVAETSFLIQKVRELARRIDDITGSAVAADLE
jgi:hypothetical protein